MKIIDLNEDNAYGFGDILEEDQAEDLERRAFRGLVIQDGDGASAAGMIWELAAEEEGRKASHICWIAVKDPEAGTELLKAYDRRISMEGVQRSVASVYIKKHSMENDALSAAGFRMKLTEGDHVSIRLSELSGMPFLKVRKLSDQVKPLSSITQKAYRECVTGLVKTGRTGLCPDIDELPRSWFENDISCYYESDKTVNGMLLFHRMPSGKLAIKLMYAFAKDQKQVGLILTMMIRQMVIAAEELYPEDTVILVERHNAAAMALSERLFPRGFGRPVYVGERQEDPGKSELTDIDRYLMM